MDKSLEAFRTIGEMAGELGVKTHILRYWEEQFPMLQPLKRAGGRRHYRPSDVALLHKINSLLNHEGYTIKGARKFLNSGGASGLVASGPTVHPQMNAQPQSLPVAELQAIRQRLWAALEAA